MMSALAVLAGCLWMDTQAALGGLPAKILFLAGASLAWGLIRAYRPLGWLASAARWVVVFAAAVLWTCWRADISSGQQSLPEPRDYLITGDVVSLPEGDHLRVQFDFAPEPADQSGLPARLRLTWYEAASLPQAAERWRLAVRLRQPRGFANPGGFDYEGQLFREGIGAVGYVRRSTDNTRLAAAGWRRPILRLRAAILEQMREVLAESSARGVMMGLAVGATDEIQSNEWEVFRATGITHLIAISGLHVTMVAVLAMALVQLYWRLPWQPALRSCRTDLMAMTGALAAAAYALLAGFSIPTQRTLVMFVAALAAVWLRRAQSPAQILSLALIGVLIFDPHAALAPGFWLSFLAVAALIWSVGRRRPMQSAVGAFLAAQGAVTVALLPVTLALFGGLSLISPLVNLIAIPFFSFWLVPAILLSLMLLSFLPSAGSVLLKLAALSFEHSWPYLQSAAHLPGAWVHLPAPSLLMLSALCIAAVLAMMPFPAVLRAVVAAGALTPVFLQRPQQPPHGGLQLTVLDVGQGLSVFVRTRTHAMLYDAGPSFRGGRSAADLAVVPFLRSRGVGRLDMFIISHPDADHAGGAPTIAEAFQLQAVRYGGSLRAADLKAVRSAASAKPCRSGEAWEWDQVRFEFLHPDAHESWNDNDSSCVLRISSRAGEVVLTGDLQRAAEEQLTGERRWSKADVVLIPHHGSRSSSTERLVSAIRPRYAIVSAGHQNRWAFPHDDVVERWCRSGAQVLNTAQWGAITIEIHPESGVQPARAYRAERRRYWHATTEAAGRSLCTR